MLNTLTSALICASALMFSVSIAVPAEAQENTSANNLRVEEVLVTATKREENLQDVPIALNVVSSEARMAA